MKKKLIKPFAILLAVFLGLLEVGWRFFNMVLVSSAFGEVPIVQQTGSPSRQSIIGERYTFPALIENSVISVSHF